MSCGDLDDAFDDMVQGLMSHPSIPLAPMMRKKQYNRTKKTVTKTSNRSLSASAKKKKEIKKFKRNYFRGSFVNDEDAKVPAVFIHLGNAEAMRRAPPKNPPQSSEDYVKRFKQTHKVSRSELEKIILSKEKENVDHNSVQYTPSNLTPEFESNGRFFVAIDDSCEDDNKCFSKSLENKETIENDDEIELFDTSNYNTTIHRDDNDAHQSNYRSILNLDAAELQGMSSTSKVEQNEKITTQEVNESITQFLDTHDLESCSFRELFEYVQSTIPDKRLSKSLVKSQLLHVTSSING